MHLRGCKEVHKKPQTGWTFELNHRATAELELELDSICSLLRVKKVEVGTSITYFSHIK